MTTKALSNPPSSKKKEEDEQPASSDEQTEELNSEEEENSSGEEEEEDSSEEEDQEKVISPPKKLLSKTQLQKSELESESESESESDESPSAYKLQPILKPAVNKEKRTHEEIRNGQPSSKSSKRSKIEVKSGADFSSRPTTTPSVGAGCINRLWGDDDEVALLKGLIESKNLKNGDFVGAAYDNIKGKLEVDVSKDQFRTKAGRLKKRFLNALNKGHDGMDPVFSKPHDVKVFELSKEVWGFADGEKKGSKVVTGAMVHKTSAKVESVPQVEEDLKKNQKDEDETKVLSSFPFLVSSFNDTTERFPSLEMTNGALKFVKDKLCLIDNAKAKELNEKWRKLLIEEVELQYKRLTLMKEQIKLALDQ